MTKRQIGLPEGFDLDIGSSPISLGDYLDEPAPVPVMQRQPKKIVSEPKIESRPEVQRVAEPEVVQKVDNVAVGNFRGERPKSKPAFESLGEVEGQREVAHTDSQKETKRKRKQVPRREFNMRPETYQMLDDLLEYAQTYSQQKDTKASELFHALITVLYQAKENLDLSDVPKRGQWGSVTAKNFPASLAQAFARAIAKQNIAKAA